MRNIWTGSLEHTGSSEPWVIQSKHHQQQLIDVYFVLSTVTRFRNLGSDFTESCKCSAEPTAVVKARVKLIFISSDCDSESEIGTPTFELKEEGSFTALHLHLPSLDVAARRVPGTRLPTCPVSL